MQQDVIHNIPSNVIINIEPDIISKIPSNVIINSNGWIRVTVFYYISFDAFHLFIDFETYILFYWNMNIACNIVSYIVPNTFTNINPWASIYFISNVIVHTCSNIGTSFGYIVYNIFHLFVFLWPNGFGFLNDILNDIRADIFFYVISNYNIDVDPEGHFDIMSKVTINVMIHFGFSFSFYIVSDMFPYVVLNIFHFIFLRPDGFGFLLYV